MTETQDERWARTVWVKAIWDRPITRLAFSAVFLAISVWALLGAFSGAAEFLAEPYAIGAFVFAPMLLVLFGLQAAQATRDLVRGETSYPIFHRLALRLDSRRGVALAGIYVVVMLGLALVLS